MGSTCHFFALSTQCHPPTNPNLIHPHPCLPCLWAATPTLHHGQAARAPELVAAIASSAPLVHANHLPPHSLPSSSTRSLLRLSKRWPHLSQRRPRSRSTWRPPPPPCTHLHSPDPAVVRVLFFTTPRASAPATPPLLMCLLLIPYPFAQVGRPTSDPVGRPASASATPTGRPCRTQADNSAPQRHYQRGTIAFICKRKEKSNIHFS